MGDFEELEKNAKGNMLVDGIIVAAVIGALFLFISSLVGIIKTTKLGGSYSLSSVFPPLILLCIATISISFYLRLIRKLKEGFYSNCVSCALPIILGILVVLSTEFGYYFWVPIGTASICYKAWLTHRTLEKDGVGNVALKYLRPIWITFFVISVIFGCVAALFDTNYWKIPNIADSRLKQFDEIYFYITQIHTPDSSITAELKDKIMEVESLANEYAANISISLFGYFVVSVAAVIYIMFYVFFRRKQSIDAVFRELNEHYKKINTGVDGNSNNSDSVSSYSEGNAEVHRENKDLSNIMRYISNKIAPFVIISRPFVSPVAGMISVAAYIDSVNIIDWYRTIFMWISVSFTCSFGFMVNDIFDVDKDQIAHKDRMIPSGRLTKAEVTCFATILATLSLLLSFGIGYYNFVINVVTMLLLIAYSLVNNKFGVIANVLSAIINALILFYGSAENVRIFDVVSLSSLVVFLFTLGREIILDLRDFDGDIAVKKTSIPILYGESTTLVIVSLIYGLVTIISIAIGIMSERMGYIICVSGIANIVMWSYLLKLFCDRTKKAIDSFVIGTRFTFLLIITGLLLP